MNKRGQIGVWFSRNWKIIGISSNDPEYDSDDSFENMKKYAEEGDYNFFYLFDESQDVAKAYGASCTPDPFLFKNENGKFSLYYHGRINDQMEPDQEATTSDMHDAIKLMLQDKPCENEIFPSIGCSIKWK